MGEHKLKLTDEQRDKERIKFNSLKGFKKPIPALYLAPGNSNIGRNQAKRSAKLKKRGG